MGRRSRDKRRTHFRIECLEDRTTPATFGVPWGDARNLTLSFVPDGTVIAGHSSTLFQTLDATGRRLSGSRPSCGRFRRGPSTRTSISAWCRTAASRWESRAIHNTIRGSAISGSRRSRWIPAHLRSRCPTIRSCRARCPAMSLSTLTRTSTTCRTSCLPRSCTRRATSSESVRARTRSRRCTLNIKATFS